MIMTGIEMFGAAKRWLGFESPRRLSDQAICLRGDELVRGSFPPLPTVLMDVPQRITEGLGGRWDADLTSDVVVQGRAGTGVLVFLFGAAGCALGPGARLRVLSEAGDVPTLASAVDISAFNAGVIGGRWLGGATVDAGLGYTSVAWSGGAIAAKGVALGAARALHWYSRSDRVRH
jgi:hypothetical protein